jgi:hypothetical protein
LKLKIRLHRHTSTLRGALSHLARLHQTPIMGLEKVEDRRTTITGVEKDSNPTKKDVRRKVLCVRINNFVL